MSTEVLTNIAVQTCECVCVCIWGESLRSSCSKKVKLTELLTCGSRQRTHEDAAGGKAVVRCTKKEGKKKQSNNSRQDWQGAERDFPNVHASTELQAHSACMCNLSCPHRHLYTSLNHYIILKTWLAVPITKIAKQEKRKGGRRPGLTSSKQRRQGDREIKRSRRRGMWNVQPKWEHICLLYLQASLDASVCARFQLLDCIFS